MSKRHLRLRGKERINLKLTQAKCAHIVLCCAIAVIPARDNNTIFCIVKLADKLFRLVYNVKKNEFITILPEKSVDRLRYLA